MDHKARKERNKYMRQWRSKNKDRVKVIQNRYWEKKAETEKEQSICNEKDDEVESTNEWNEWNKAMKGNGYQPTLEEEMNLNVGEGIRYVGKGIVF